jgi:hypothetical protein
LDRRVVQLPSEPLCASDNVLIGQSSDLHRLNFNLVVHPLNQ